MNGEAQSRLVPLDKSACEQDRERFLDDLDSIELEPERLEGAEWFLGYDGDCPRCTSVQALVQEIAGNTVVPVSLHEPVVAGWRKEAFGDAAPWAPTLFRVKDGKVEAWTGKRLAVRLATVIGPRKGWHLAEKLAETQAAPPADQRGFLGRRSFLKGLAGVTAGLAMLKTVELGASANSAGWCGVGYNLAAGNDRILSGGANCRRCPTTVLPDGDIDAFVPGGQQYYWSYYTTDGQYVYDPALGYAHAWWFHSAGPTGCWVHGSRLP